MKMIRHTLLGITATVALMIAIATAAPAGSTGPLKTSAQAMLPSASSPEEEMVSRLIVKPRAQADAKLAGALQAFDASGLSKTANVPMTVFRPMSGDAYVIKLDQPVTLSEARVIAERLMRNDSSVEFAEPDRSLYPTATTPTDPGYLPYQWHYFAPAGSQPGWRQLAGCLGCYQGQRFYYCCGDRHRLSPARRPWPGIAGIRFHYRYHDAPMMAMAGIAMRRIRGIGLRRMNAAPAHPQATPVGTVRTLPARSPL